MKKISLYVTFFLVLVNVWAIHAGVQGALPGAFSVSATKKVYFSQGNLQYQASTNTWRFAEYQSNYVGKANENRSLTYTGWIDNYCYGNSGYKGSSSHEPWKTWSGLTINISGTNYDWGVYNAISNGGNKAGLWRTLTKAEWTYLVNTRANASSRRGQASVDGTNGLVLLPDVWSKPSGISFTANPGNYTTNVYTMSQWAQMEAAGAVFLPAAGYFSTTSSSYGTRNVGTAGYYWSSSYTPGLYSEELAGALYFTASSVSPSNDYKTSSRLNVRLVIDSDKNVAYTITWKNWDGTTLATTSVLKGATPSYTGATPTRPSTAEYAYTFSGWTPAITVATADKTYTATYTATPRYTITFNANGGLIPTGGNMGNTPSGHITTLSTDRTSGTVVVTKDKTHFQTMTNDCPSREGYTFAGWYTDPTSGVQVYDNTGYRVVGTYWNSEGKWIGTSNVTLYTAAGGGTYDYGTNHQITATPNECYRFVQWSDGNTENPRTITVTGDATYTAEFEQIQYTIEALSDDPMQGSATVTNP